MLYIVVNAGDKEDDFALIERAAAGARHADPRRRPGADRRCRDPRPPPCWRRSFPDAADLAFMTSAAFDYAGDGLIVSRSRLHRRGRLRDPGPAPTPPRRSGTRLLADARVKPIGLGARDFAAPRGRPAALRPRPRRDRLADRGRPHLRRHQAPPRRPRDFPGAARIARELAGGLARVRVGLRVLEGAPAREGAEIADAAGARHRPRHHRRLLAQRSARPSPWASCRRPSPRPAPR